MKDCYMRDESNQRQNNETLEHQSRISACVQAEEYNLFNILKPKIYIDGDEWCVLYGDNMQEGIAGFGKSPYKAILDWNKSWNNDLFNPSASQRCALDDTTKAH